MKLYTDDNKGLTVCVDQAITVWRSWLTTFLCQRSGRRFGASHLIRLLGRCATCGVQAGTDLSQVMVEKLASRSYICTSQPNVILSKRDEKTWHTRRRTVIVLYCGLDPCPRSAMRWFMSAPSPSPLPPPPWPGGPLKGGRLPGCMCSRCGGGGERKCWANNWCCICGGKPISCCWSCGGSGGGGPGGRIPGGKGGKPAPCSCIGPPPFGPPTW